MIWIISVIILILVGINLILPEKVCAALPPLSIEELKRRADYIVIGIVIDVCESEVKIDIGSNYQYIAAIQVESLESRFPPMPPILPGGEPNPSYSSQPRIGSEIKIHYWRAGQRIQSLPGPQGQSSSLVTGTKVRLFIKKDAEGRFHLLEPNGWESISDDGEE